MALHQCSNLIKDTYTRRQYNQPALFGRFVTLIFTSIYQISRLLSLKERVTIITAMYRWCSWLRPQLIAHCADMEMKQTNTVNFVPSCWDRLNLWRIQFFIHLSNTAEDFKTKSARLEFRPQTPAVRNLSASCRLNSCRALTLVCRSDELGNKHAQKTFKRVKKCPDIWLECDLTRVGSRTQINIKRR